MKVFMRTYICIHILISIILYISLKGQRRCWDTGKSCIRHGGVREIGLLLVIKNLKNNRVTYTELKWADRYITDVNPLSARGIKDSLSCNEFGRVCFSRTVLFSCKWTQRNTPNYQYDTQQNFVWIYTKLCKSAIGSFSTIKQNIQIIGLLSEDSPVFKWNILKVICGSYEPFKTSSTTEMFHEMLVWELWDLWWSYSVRSGLPPFMYLCKWRCTIHEGTMIFQKHVMSWANAKGSAKKGENPSIYTWRVWQSLSLQCRPR